jgi:hypothetical protein
VPELVHNVSLIRKLQIDRSHIMAINPSPVTGNGRPSSPSSEQLLYREPVFILGIAAKPPTLKMEKRNEKGTAGQTRHFLDELKTGLDSQFWLF